MSLHAFQPKDDRQTFKVFWSRYPRRQARKDAEKAWAQLNPSDELIQEICDHLEQRVKTRQWREGFIPLPATFLRGERWTDELTADDYYQAKL